MNIKKSDLKKVLNLWNRVHSQEAHITQEITFKIFIIKPTRYKIRYHTYLNFTITL